MGDAEEKYHQTTAALIAAVITEGAKFHGAHRIALTSNILNLVPKLPINPVLMLGVDLPPGMDSAVTGVTNIPIPTGSIQQLFIKFVYPVTQVPLLPSSSIYMKTASELHPPLYGWKYGFLKASSTPVTSTGYKQSKDKLNLDELDNDVDIPLDSPKKPASQDKGSFPLAKNLHMGDT